MTADAHESGTVPTSSVSDIARTPRSIRAALLPEDVEGFERDYRAVMAEAAQTLDLSPVFECLDHWSLIARLSQDAGAHRAMLDTAARLKRGEEVPSRPARDVLADLGF
ncbi:hypothetical protein D5H75_07495 [Bailinhaonella thermotolerans]|uniref:Uncharacterized protein n=1 Tax=Bailinhaonella thermotolerans TaxID=1070861 RepID=A0A3A4AWK2_9ACTN|nr:hypothetical protein D5H75_07495 [Bailinhaonella thermotolerans]